MYSSGEYTLLALPDREKGATNFQNLPRTQAGIISWGSLATPWAEFQQNLNRSLAPPHFPFRLLCHLQSKARRPSLNFRWPLPFNWFFPSNF